jgi:hypothetical protein
MRAGVPEHSKLQGEPVEKKRSGVHEGAARPLRPCQEEGVAVEKRSWGRESWCMMAVCCRVTCRSVNCAGWEPMMSAALAHTRTCGAIGDDCGCRMESTLGST